MAIQTAVQEQSLRQVALSVRMTFLNFLGAIFRFNKRDPSLILEDQVGERVDIIKHNGNGAVRFGFAADGEASCDELRSG